MVSTIKNHNILKENYTSVFIILSNYTTFKHRLWWWGDYRIHGRHKEIVPHSGWRRRWGFEWRMRCHFDPPGCQLQSQSSAWHTHENVSRYAKRYWHRKRKDGWKDTVLVVEEAASCRCQVFVRGINQWIDVATLIFSQAFLCPPARAHKQKRLHSVTIQAQNPFVIKHCTQWFEYFRKDI